MKEHSFRGTTPQAGDRELADIALAVYDTNVANVGRWARLDGGALNRSGIPPEVLERPDSGFRAAIFSDGRQHVLAFAGTDEWKEIRTNARQAFGRITDQYDAAVRAAMSARVAFGPELVLTGHSLGGGLASVAASAINSPAVTFNAAGVHSKSFERIDLDPAEARNQAANGLVRAYVVKGEILTKMQDVLPIPKAPGSRIDLAEPKPLKGIRSVLPISRTMRSVKLHSMDSVIAAIAKDDRFARGDPKPGPATVSRANEVLKQSGMSEKSASLVTEALSRKIETQQTAGRIPPKAPSRDLGRSR